MVCPQRGFPHRARAGGKGALGDSCSWCISLNFYRVTRLRVEGRLGLCSRMDFIRRLTFLRHHPPRPPRPGELALARVWGRGVRDKRRARA